MNFGQRQLMMGNEACAAGAIAAGVRYFAAYPITPATEIGEVLSRELPAYGGKFIQMEDEMGALGSCLGASAAGVKAMTASSGPGITLMQENVGLAAMAEIPVVIVNVQRAGPGTGTIDQTQADVMQARWGTNGDHPVIALAPSSVKECFDLTVRAVNLSERYRVPVYLLSDAQVGHMREVVTLPRLEDVRLVDRPRPTCRPDEYHGYEFRTPDEVPPMADFGTGYHYIVQYSVHDRDGFPNPGKPAELAALLQHLDAKLSWHLDAIVDLEELLLDDADIVVVAYGTTARAARDAVVMARARGRRAGLLRLVTVWPFDTARVGRIIGDARRVVVPEMNLGQIHGEVVKATKDRRAQVLKVNRVDGCAVTPQEILDTIERGLG
ncbi:MAG: 2-oxoacid:acceptor oxidoreductase subunit alpha [Candidatus Rokubacteria bacterium]|nr:2-oxoacid:acceptor oxidoreductase subunit alpha [Candidatus Rokubacteria bacterium]